MHRRSLRNRTPSEMGNACRDACAADLRLAPRRQNCDPHVRTVVGALREANHHGKGSRNYFGPPGEIIGFQCFSGCPSTLGLRKWLWARMGGQIWQMQPVARRIQEIILPGPGRAEVPTEFRLLMMSQAARFAEVPAEDLPEVHGEVQGTFRGDPLKKVPLRYTSWLQ